MSREETNTPNEGVSYTSKRRALLKALGAGSGLALVGGVGAGGTQYGDDENGDDENGGDDTDTDAGTDDDQQTGDNYCEPCIDRLAGYTALADDDEADWPAEPDHEVEMYVEPRNVLFEEAPAPPGMGAAPEEPSDESEEGTPTEGEEPSDESEQEEPSDDDEQMGEDDQSGDEEQPEGEEQFPDFFYDPVGLRVEPGDVVAFYNNSGSIHTVTAFSPRFNEPPFLQLPQRVPEESPQFSSPPVAVDETWLFRFEEPGVYDVLCLPHYELGMVARVVVTEADADAPAEPEGTEELPLGPRTVFEAPEMTVENILDVESVGWDDLTIEERLNPGDLFGEGPAEEPEESGEEPEEE